jgi:Tfp pilus assembly protein PilN
MLRSKNTLGINIGQDWISAALLRQVKDEIRLEKVAQAPVPEGAIIDGNIVAPAILAKALNDMLKQNRISTRKAVVSLVARPMLIQTIDLPEEIPGNIGQFILSEIKHSPALAGKEPYFDFCRLSSGAPDGKERMFIAATDNEKILVLLKTLGLAKVDATAIEPSLIARLRALYSKKISTRYGCNLIVTLIDGPIVTICVFRKEELDFIRSIDLSEQDCGPDEFIARCETEINAVIQFYDIEIADADDKWEFVVELDNPAISTADMQFFLERKFGTDVAICSSSTVYTATTLAENASIDNASIAAVGLAMKNIETPGFNININTMPAEAKMGKDRKRFVLITANIAAAILLCMFIMAGFVRAQLDKAEQAMIEDKQGDPTGNIEQLLSRQRSLNEQIACFSGKINRMNAIFDNDSIGNWPEILNDIRAKMPESVYITEMNSEGGTTILVDGNALSFNSIQIFAELLCQSKSIESATVTERNKSHEVNGLVSYSINCILASTEEPQIDVE